MQAPTNELPAPAGARSRVSWLARLSSGDGGGPVLMMSGTVVTQLMLLGTGIITARLLGVEGRGQVALVLAISTLVARLTLGGSLPVAVAQLMARDGLNAKAALRPYARRWALLAAAPSLAGAGYLYLILDEAPPGLRAGLAAGTAAMAVVVMSTNLLAAAIQGELASVGRLMTAGLLLQVPFFVALVSAFAMGWQASSGGVVLLFIASSLVGLALCWRMLRPRAAAASTGERLDARELRKMTRANYINAIGSIDGIGLDRNLVGAMLGTVSLGLYSAATAVANVSTMVGRATSMVLLPRLAAAHDDPDEQARLLRRWVPATLGLIVLIVLSLQAVIEPVIVLAFGEEFAPAVACARLLVIADGLLGFRRVLIAILQARGQGGNASWVELSLTVVLTVGIVVAALQQSLLLVGAAMVVVGVLSCALLWWAILGSRRRAPART